jgi:hypothetical protein
MDSTPTSRSPEANRAVVYTNKRSAFYCTQTHRDDRPEHAYFRGFNDYTLSIDGRPLDPSLATAVTAPGTQDATSDCRAWSVASITSALMTPAWPPPCAGCTSPPTR